MTTLDAREIAAGVRTGELLARDVLETCLDRIAARNPELNAFVFVDAARARAVADAVDAAVAAGRDPGPLAGVPLGIKELEEVEGWPFTSASTVFADRVGARTSVMTSRLVAAGCVPVGLTASPEIGHLFYTTSLLHGPTRNPWDLDRTPGGSSGGAGAALAAGLVPLCTGSDMGGSIRLPAGWSGVVGVKGTLGRVPRGPGYLGSANLIHYGPLARTVGDAARFLDVAAGVDARDPMSLPAPAEPFESAMVTTDLAGLRLGVVDDLGLCPSHPEVAACLHDAAPALAAAIGGSASDVVLEVPEIATGAAAQLVVDRDPALGDAMNQVMVNLFATPGAGPLFEYAYGSLALDLDALAGLVRMRHELNERIAALFERVDVIALPTAPVPAFGCEGPIPTEVAGREVGPAASALFTSPFNLSGHPVVAVPMGLVDGCPVGMQLVTRRHDDALVLALAAAFERARPWPKLAPGHD